MRRLHLEKTRAGVLFHLQITVDMELPCWELQQEMGGHQMGVSASKEGVVHNRSFFVILTTDSFEALFISYFKPAGIW